MTDHAQIIETATNYPPERDAQDMAIAREALLLTRPDFADLSPYEQQNEIADFVLARRHEFANSPELREWLNAGNN